MDRTQQSAGADFLAGGGEMGALIRSLDWSKTPLGPVEDWPQSLRSALSILLASRAQIVLFWGPDLVALYNDAYRPVFGVKHPWALGKPARECWSEVWDVLGPLFGDVLTAGRAFWAQDHLFFLERHGFSEEMYFDVSYDPVRVEGGGIGGVFCIVTDTTGRVLSERRMRTLRDLGARAAETRSPTEACQAAADVLAERGADIPFALLYLLDPQGTRARLTATVGVTPGGAASPEAVDLLGDPAAAVAGWPLGTAHIAGSVQVDDLAARFGPLPGGPWPEAPRTALVLPLAAPGQERPAGLLVAGISPRLALDDTYREFLVLVAAQIATAIANARAHEEERRRAEALAEIDRAKTAFFSNVSHEFRTPLTLMLGPVEDILANPEDALAPASRELLTVVQRNGRRLQRLVNALLDFSRIEAGRIEAVYQATDLAAVTIDLASNFRAACERAGLELVVSCPPLPAPVYVDRDMWEKIVLNLLSNAFKFTFEGTIEVSLAPAGEAVELTVRDTGIGIPPDELPQIFERFHRVVGARGRTHEGTGIGLALIQELVKLHGGAVRVESTEGRGSRFVVRLPTGRAHLPADRIGATSTLASTALGVDPYVEEALRWLPDADPQPIDGFVDGSTALRPRGAGDPALDRPPRIVWADDNADMREYVRRLLSGAYEVEAVADGEAALAAIRARRPDLVLADVMMPRLDGFGLIRELRADPELRTVPVILLSARAGEEARLEGLGLAPDDYLVKPFSARELLVRVAALLHLSEIRRQALEQERRGTARLREHEMLLTAVVEQMPVGLGLLDLEGRFILKNVRMDRFVGSVIPSLDDAAHGRWRGYHADGRRIERFDYPGRRALRGEVDPGTEYAYLNDDGTETWTRVAAVPLRDERGRLTGAICVVQDIDVIKRAEEALREADRRKDDFLATLSHELRTPLNSMLGWTRMLRSGAIEPAKVQHALEIIDRNIQAQNQIITDLLDVSRIVSGKMTLEKGVVNLAALVTAVADSMRPAAEAKQIRITTTLGRVPPTWGDPERLQQVVWNLVSNAVKFTGVGGHIDVALDADERSARIAVRDTGKGIDPRFMPYLFDRFRQADSSSTRASSGLGLGLALVRNLVELHGGEVSAASDGEDTGALFTVTLPLVAPPPARERSEAAVVPPRGPGGTAARLRDLKILVVDDHADTCELLGVILRGEGASVWTASSATQARKLLQAQTPDALLCDIAMPGENGLTFIRDVRSSGPGQGGGIPAIALTAHARPEDRDASIAAGFQDHIAKPVDPEKLLEALLAVVGRERSRS